MSEKRPSSNRKSKASGDKNSGKPRRPSAPDKRTGRSRDDASSTDRKPAGSGRTQRTERNSEDSRGRKPFSSTRRGDRSRDEDSNTGRKPFGSRNTPRPERSTGSAGPKRRYTPNPHPDRLKEEGAASSRTPGDSTRSPRPSRGKFDNQSDRPSRGKSRDADHTKGQTRRNSTDVKKEASGFKVTRVKGKERELVWDSDPAPKKAPVSRAKSSSPRDRSKSKAEGYIRLNRYIANAGVCSRREADVLIKAGVVQVNGEVVTEMGVKVGPDDVVHYAGQKLSREKNVYVLLNKPKDYVTTMRDPEGRKSVHQLVKSACKERIVPVGRLDRLTTGLLLFTNDGDLAKKLSHPKHGVSKLYHLELDKKVSGKDIQNLLSGVILEDGEVKADKVSYVGDNQRELGMEIHMGKNRVVRRMMEELGYKVLKLDRVMFAGLTKKNLPKGKFRHLTETEVGQLKSRG